MREGKPSATAQRVAAYRLDFDRLVTPQGDPLADERLAQDVVGGASFERSETMARYLRGRTSFFDRVVVKGLERGVTQVVTIGAGYDGRSLRYAHPGVRWFEVDHPHTQQDKRARLDRLGIDSSPITFVSIDLQDPGLASALVVSGYDPNVPAQIICEGVAVYLTQLVLETLLEELRSLVTVGTRLAISFSTAASLETHDRFQAAVGRMGEPVRTVLTAEGAAELLTVTGWRAAAVSERAQRAGLVVATPDWGHAQRAAPPTTSRLGLFMERTYHRAGPDRLAGHLESTYGVKVAKLQELDVGVVRVDRRDGVSWVARVFPAARPIEAVKGDAEILRSLAASGFPAERGADPDPVSIHEGQGVMVTEFVPGRRPPAE